MISSLLRIVSRVMCLIVIASFVIFVVDQTSSASTGQQREIYGATPSEVSNTPEAHASGLHKTIDEASERLTSPFSGVTSGTTNKWIIHGADTLLALLIYGFGLGFIARMVSLRT